MANNSQNSVRRPPVDDERRREILVAATDLFLELGYDRATLDMLIERIGGSRRAIYNLFGNKEGLLGAIVQGRCASLGRELEALSLEGLAPRVMLRRFALMAARTILSPENTKLFRLVVQESGRNPSLGRQMYEEGVSVAHGVMADYFRSETRAGRLNVRHPDDAASMFFGMVIGDLHFIALFWGYDTLTEAYLKRRADRVVDVFLSGVALEDGGS